ncbi:hypothetical protein MTR_5g046145 [Medicago truncatula]|uniref:Uncharacterized protein n=1 Tax=Medicago truncatula TaxID=3880 RepID=A0A072UFK9_MEDTR|nr:hypothetical protein MTR_5g046145 [Medicago truncatula]
MICNLQIRTLKSELDSCVPDFEIRTAPVHKLCSFSDYACTVFRYVAPVDAPNVNPPDIGSPNVSRLLLLEDAYYSGNAKYENPPPPSPKLEISLGGSKADDASPPIPHVVPPPFVAVCIKQREHFTTKHKFATRNDLLEWVREKARKLGFFTVIGNFDNDDICERGGSYAEYKRKSRREIAGSVKCECPFRMRGYLLTGGDWSLIVGDGKHNHDMTDVLKGHKTVGRLNPNERVHLEEMVDSNVPLRQMLTILKKRNRIGGPKCKLDCKVTDLKGKNGQAIKPGSVVKTVMAAWMDIVDSETEKAYIDNWTRFKVLYAKFPKFLEYVEKTILDPVKEKFVRFWVDKNLHMGNTTTNRAESAHAQLKK